MAIPYKPLHSHFGIEILNFSVSENLSSEIAKELRRLVEVFGVVLIRNQDMPEQKMIKLSEHLGGAHKFIPLEGQSNEFVYRVTNLGDDGNILPLDDAKMRSNVANELWHTDTTFVRPRTALSMLYAIEVAAEGGETEFCDTRCAYEALTEDERYALEGLVGMHSIIHSRALTGFHDWTDQQREVLKPVARPLVEFHEPSGRHALCIASHVGEIDPLPSAEASALLQRLTDIATRPEYVYAHHWAPKDLLIWDNRCTMHRARPYNYTEHRRDYRTARVDDMKDMA